MREVSSSVIVESFARYAGLAPSRLAALASGVASPARAGDRPASLARSSEILEQERERLGHAPGLGRRAARPVRRVGVEDLAELAQAGLLEVALEAAQEDAAVGQGLGRPPLDQK